MSKRKAPVEASDAPAAGTPTPIPTPTANPTPAPTAGVDVPGTDLRADFKDGKKLRNGKDVAGTKYNTSITAEHAAPETAIKANESAHFTGTGMDPYEVYSMSEPVVAPPGP